MNPRSLDCADCEARLVDLLEIRRAGDDEERDGLETLLARCPSCRDRLARLEDGLAFAAELPLEEPPRQIDAVVMAAARARAAAVAEAASPSGPSLIDGGFWDRLVQQLGGLAMRPQVTMATLTLLVVVLGVWTLRPGSAPDRLSDVGEVVREPELAAEPAPSYTPAPEQLAEARRSRRPVSPARPERGEPSGAVGDRTRETEDADGDAASRRDDLGELAQLVESDQRIGDLSGPSSGNVRQRAMRRGLRSRSAYEGDVGRSGLGASAPSSPSGGAGRSAPGAGDAYVPQVDDEAAEASPMEESAAEAPAARAAAPVAPAPGPTREVPTLAAQLHQQARAARSSGQTATAIRRYEELLARFPSYLRRGEALVELGDVYRGAGRLSDARRAYARARRHPRVARRAQTQLESMEAPAPAAEPAEATAAEAQ